MRGRKPEPDGKRVTLCAKVSEPTAALIDAARGQQTRSAWLQELIAGAIHVAPEVAPQKTPPVSAGRRQELRAMALAADIEPITDASELGRRSIEAHAGQIAAQSRPAKNCKHPKVRVKGVCPDCREWVAGK